MKGANAELLVIYVLISLGVTLLALKMISFQKFPKKNRKGLNAQSQRKHGRGCDVMNNYEKANRYFQAVARRNKRHYRRQPSDHKNNAGSD